MIDDLSWMSFNPAGSRGGSEGHIQSRNDLSVSPAYYHREAEKQNGAAL